MSLHIFLSICSPKGYNIIHIHQKISVRELLWHYRIVHRDCPLTKHYKYRPARRPSIGRSDVGTLRSGWDWLELRQPDWPTSGRVEYFTGHHIIVSHNIPYWLGWPIILLFLYCSNLVFQEKTRVVPQHFAGKYGTHKVLSNMIDQSSSC